MEKLYAKLVHLLTYSDMRQPFQSLCGVPTRYVYGFSMNVDGKVPIRYLADCNFIFLIFIVLKTNLMAHAGSSGN